MIVRFKIQTDKTLMVQGLYVQRCWIMLSDGGYIPLFKTRNGEWTSGWGRNFPTKPQAITDAITSRYDNADGLRRYRRCRSKEQSIRIKRP